MGKLKNKLVGLLAGAAMLTGCSNKPDRLLFDGVIDGQRVVYYDGDINSPDRMEIYNDGKLSKIIEDWDENGFIGDKNSNSPNGDKYIIITGENKQITYGSFNGYFSFHGPFVTDEQGRRFYSRDDIEKKVLELRKLRLNEATQTYRDLKAKIASQIEADLNQHK